MPLNLLILSMNASGHANPQLPLAEELVKRGHNVTYICGQPFQASIEKTGARWVEGLPPATPPPSVKDDDPNRFQFFIDKLIEGAKTNITAYDSELRDTQFDAILHGSFSLAGPIIGKWQDIPVIQLWASFTSEPGVTSAIEKMMGISAEVLWKDVDLFMERYSMLPYHPFESSSEYNISFVPHFFQPYSGEYPDNFYFIGPTMSERVNDHLWEKPNDNRPLIFISLGTVFNQRSDFFSKCIEAFRDGKYQVVMSIGESISLEDLPAIPDNFMVAASFPQPKILKSADIFLSHAGMNSSMEGIYNEVPFVLYPQMEEQESNAEKLVELGLGKLLPAECTSTEIRAVVDSVYENPVYKDNAVKYGSLIRTAGGAVRGATIVEDIVQHHHEARLSVSL